MAKLKLEDIKYDLKKFGWVLVSEKYKNLDEPLEMMCDKGHTIFAPYRKVRHVKVCDVCEKLSYASSSQAATPKGGEWRVLGIDQSTSTTGWAVFDDKELVKSGFFEAKEKDTFTRMSRIRGIIRGLIELWKPDYVLFEDIQLQDFGGKGLRGEGNVVGIKTFKTLARLQGILGELCLELDIPFDFCAPSTWRSTLRVKGRSRADKKRSTQLQISKIYNVEVGEDEADAIGIGYHAASNPETQPETKKVVVEMHKFE